MKSSKAAERVSVYGARAESIDLWTAVLGDPRAGVAVSQLGRDVRTMPVGQLQRLAHIGPARAVKVLAAVELGRRLASIPLVRGRHITSPEDIFDAYGPRLLDTERESFWVVCLDTKNRIICDEQVYVGSLTQCAVTAPDVLRTAIRVAAVSVIVAHCHPSSGDPTPSPEDYALTEALFHAANTVGVILLDHVVIGDGAYYSFVERGKLPL